MKKIYVYLMLLCFTFQLSKAQLSLTKAANEPVIGNVSVIQQYDSLTAVPKTTGTNQNWNFNNLIAQINTETDTYTTVASTPSAAIFPGATISESQGSGNFTHFKSTSTTFEYQGVQFPGVCVSFSNTGIFATWPINMGYNATDAFGGSTTTGTTTSSLFGNINVNGSGTGTVVMPGGLTLTNCLQVIESITFTLAVNTSTQGQVQKTYSYYHSSNKFPVLTVQYQTMTTGTTVSTSATIYVNTAIVAGIKANTINTNLSVFPNPTSDMINIVLDNRANKEVKVCITNMLGKIVKTENIGNESSINSTLNVSDLAKGVYFMNVKIGETVSTKKIIVE